MKRAILLAATLCAAGAAAAQPTTMCQECEPITARTAAPDTVLEVMSAVYPYIHSVSADLTGNATAIRITANNLNYEAKGRVRVDAGQWVSLDNASVTCDAASQEVRCIGFPGTIAFDVPIPVAAGRHTIQFEYSRTDGFSSGYRILSLEFVGAGGAAAPATVDTGQPTYGPGDPGRGDALFHGRNRWIDHPSGVATIAACNDCHVEGRDLKYFGFSDHSIVVRTVFHGGSVEDGEDIAAYIQSLDVPTTGTPWDPPYQPGPGLDEKPLIEWAAGAGLEAIVEEPETRAYIFGADGITADDFTSPPNLRELPLSAALPDWNQWLPRQWPGECHAGTEDWDLQEAARANMYAVASNPEATAKEVENAINAWSAKVSYTKNNNGTCDGSDQEKITAEWSALAWQLVQYWYIQHKFGLAERAKDVYGHPEDAGVKREWIQRGRYAFNLGPHIANVNGLSNPPFRYASRWLDSYMTHLWYQVQATTNPGLTDDRASGQIPVDWGYQNSFLRGRDAPYRTIASRMLQLHAMSDSPCQIAGGNVVAGNATCLGDQPANPFWLAGVYGWSNKDNEIFDSMPEPDKLRIASFGLDWYLSRLEDVPEFERGESSGQWKDASYNPETGDQKHTYAYDIADMWWVRSATLKSLGVPDATMRRWDAMGERLWPLANWESLTYPGNADLPAADPNPEPEPEPEPDPIPDPEPDPCLPQDGSTASPCDCGIERIFVDAVATGGGYYLVHAPDSTYRHVRDYKAMERAANVAAKTMQPVTVTHDYTVTVTPTVEYEGAPGTMPCGPPIYTELEVSAEGGGLYVVTVDGAIATQHTTIHAAMESHRNLRTLHPEAAVETRQALVIR